MENISMGTTSGSTWMRRRLQLYDASGSWSDFNVAVRPALVERQNKRAEKADIKVRARRLEEETRAWTVLPEKESDDEYDDDDDEAALERARAKMEVAKVGKREGGRTPLLVEMTQSFLSQDAAFWMESGSGGQELLLRARRDRRARHATRVAFRWRHGTLQRHRGALRA